MPDSRPHPSSSDSSSSPGLPGLPSVRPRPPGRAYRRRRRAAASLAVVAAAAVGLVTPAGSSAAVPAGEAAAGSRAASADPVSAVDPMIGTSNAGNTYPGAATPFGMLSWSPQTSQGDQTGNPAPGGYQYDAKKIRGFSLTHLSGVGCSGANGDVPIMPYPGEVTSSPSADTEDATYASAFSHDHESAHAGEYGVGLDSGARARLTSSARTGTGLFDFPAGKPASMLLRTSNSETGSSGATVHVDRAARTVTGSVTAGNFCGPQSENNRHSVYTLHFTAHFDRPFAKSGTWHDGSLRRGSDSASGGTGWDGKGKPKAGKGSGGYVTFPEGTRHVRAKVAVSYVSAKGAEANLAAENPHGTGFGDLRARARDAWRDRLRRIEVGGASASRRRTFYTALYHSMLEPTLVSDADGRYTGADGKRHRVSGRQKKQYGTFSGWDQYRAQVQLMALLDPKEASDYAQSLYHFARQRGGVWDRWLLEHGRTSVMSGDPSDLALAGIHAFGGRDFDVKGALRSLKRAAKVPTADDSSDAGCNVECVGQRPSLKTYLKSGYVPADDCHCWGGAAETLEDAAADYGISELARRTGDDATRREFLRRSGNWRHVFDPHATSEGGYARDRKADGKWAGDRFDPGTEDGFVEGTSARYTWMVYADPAGLARAMGGAGKASDRLDRFFRKPDGSFDFTAKEPTRYDPTNEPDINAPYLYDYFGKPYRTQETVRAELDRLWKDTPGGIPGNDDAGTMSAWYVFSALGVYPQNPGRADLALSTPLFPHAKVHTGNGKTLVVNAPGASADARYIRHLKVDGRTSSRPWVPASFVEHGGTLDFGVGDKPDKKWGAAPADAPPSFPAKGGRAGARR